MKVFKMFALIAFLSAAPSAATENDLNELLQGEVFSSRGLCEASLVRERNERRQHDGNTGGYSDPVYNQVVHDKYSCIEIFDRVWVAVPDWGANRR